MNGCAVSRVAFLLEGNHANGSKKSETGVLGNCRMLSKMGV